jgi:NAD(P)H-flavin reductase/ferredoxin
MKVRLEPIGEEIDCAADETVLDAAFRQGYNLVYGCREGQCSACKCFLQEGDVALKRYSNFALSDSERESGYSLMCRAMPEQDLVVELLHYDPENYRLRHAISDGEATVEAVEPLTHDITRLVLRADEFDFTPGQYVDLHVPGEQGVTRSFSMANLPGDGLIELMIKRYPGGRLSGMLDGQISPGEKLGITGPYGAFRVRDSKHPILMIAGGSGMAPILSVLRHLARDACERPVRFFYGARTEADLFHLSEIEELGAQLRDFRFTPVVERFVHVAVGEYLTTRDITTPDVYMCGPPPMIEAAEEMLTGEHGVDEARIFSDKFTTSADAAPAAQDAPPVKRVDSAPAPAGNDLERDFAWFTPSKRRASLYEDVTIDTQPSIHRHLTRGWPMFFEDGRGTWDDDSTKLRSSDWYAFRDPGEQWERPYYQRASAVENQIESAMRSAAREGLIADFAPDWVEFLRTNLQVAAYIEHGLWFALATIGRDCLSDSVATCVCLQAAMKQRSAQALVLYAMDLEEHHGPFPITQARETFLHHESWQPTRRLVERLAATHDWGEVIVAANLCFEPIVGTMLRRELGIRAAAGRGDTVTPVIAQVANHEWEWAREWTTELIRMLLCDPEHGEHNRATIDGWLADWQPGAQAAADALGRLAPVDAVTLSSYSDALLAEAGLDGAAFSEHADRPTRRMRPARTRRAPAAVGDHAAPAADLAPANGDGGYDYVGIVMAKSAEGDAVAEILRRRDGIEVIEQPSFWDIRAKVRLAIPYAEVSDQLGYEIDAYSIQHEMSTHYGRLVATDDALMLFSDPTEAMQYLMS